jgi:hypothetical protein
MNTASIVSVSIAGAIAAVALIFALTDMQVSGNFRIGRRNPPAAKTPKPEATP